MRKFLALSCILFSALFICSCNRVVPTEDTDNNSHLFLKSDESEIISLAHGWAYALEDPLEENSVQFTNLTSEQLQNLESLIPGGTGYIYLIKIFKVPESLKYQNLGCYLGRITMTDQTWVNGTFIGQTGRLPPNYFSAWNTVRFYTIPENVLNDDWNEIVVKIWVDGEGSIVSSPFIGTMSEAKKAAEIEAFWNSKIQFAFAFLMMIIAGYNFLLYFKQKRKSEYNMFALINLFSAIYMSVFYINEIPWLPTANMSFLWYEKIFDNALTFAFPFMVTSFLNFFLKRKESSVALALRSACVVFPIIMVLVVPSYPILHSIRIWIQALLVPPMIYLLYIIIDSVSKKKEETIPLLWGLSPLVFAVVFDLLIHNVLHLYYLPYFTTIGWQVVIIAILFIMTGRLSYSLNEVENLNKHLEEKVEARTKELSESNDKLSETNDELKNVNNKLEESRLAAERDMKLAIYVQQSFYPKKAPLVDGWSIAYHFQPASGVSGDLYDFFTDDNKLLGLGLFDVSGHGISAGLVGMLAKGVVERVFAEEITEPFGKVMNDINNLFISEKSDVENYLTGVLLRINENHVEFVNAGHPPVLYRTANGQKVIPVRVPGSDTNMTDTGSIIGIDGLPASFKPIGFNMNPGDSIILYTDCLNESRSKDGEMFGTDGIQKAFADSGNGSAQEKLDYVIKQFKDFTQDTILNDDLTIIVLQKTK